MSTDGEPFVPPLPEDDPEDVVASEPPVEPLAKKRKSRWGDEDKKVNIAPVQTVIPTSLNSAQLEQYLLQSRLEEVNRKLKSGDVVPPERERSPSPEPTYDSQGKRTNMRETRYRKKLEDERNRLVELAMKNNPAFRPPSDYKKNVKLSDKVYIPTRAYPEINFIGLLIGPRGNELKKIEKEAGAKISIRGRGSIKEGKYRADPSITMGADEELHAYITAESEEKIAAAVKVVKNIIDIAISTPEGENELKQKQLRELAALNGTLRDEDSDTCNNCGATGHRKYDCPEARNFTNNLICRICGGAGHIARDCVNRNNSEMLQESRSRHEKLSSEYSHFMAEISGKTGISMGGSPATMAVPLSLGKSSGPPATNIISLGSRASAPTATTGTMLSKLPPASSTSIPTSTPTPMPMPMPMPMPISLGSAKPAQSLPVASTMPPSASNYDYAGYYAAAQMDPNSAAYAAWYYSQFGYSTDPNQASLSATTSNGHADTTAHVLPPLPSSQPPSSSSTS